MGFEIVDLLNVHFIIKLRLLVLFLQILHGFLQGLDLFSKIVHCFSLDLLVLTLVLVHTDDVR